MGKGSRAKKEKKKVERGVGVGKEEEGECLD